MEVFVLHRALKLAALAAFASLVAACSGNGNSTVPAAVAPQSDLRMVSATMAYAPNGDVVRILPSRDFTGAIGLPTTPSTGVALQSCHHNCSTNLTLHGGPVSTTPTVYLVLYGSAWGGANGGGSGDPHAAATYLQSFYSHMGGTSWHNTDTQYYGANGVHIPNTTALAGTIYDSTNPPSSPTQSQLAAEATKIAGQTGHYGPNYSYVIALPSGVSPSGFKTQYCAWHSSTSASGGVVSYTNLPYQSDAGTSCGVGSVTSPGYDDGFSIVGGHEQVETETDPQPNTGWLDGSGSENGDKCAWKNLQNTNLNGTSFPTQPIWSNAITGCTQST